jgi:hypothetical protein
MVSVSGTELIPISVRIPASVPPLGRFLLERRLVTEEQLEVGIAQHEWSGRPLAEVLVALGFVSETTVAQGHSETELPAAPASLQISGEAPRASDAPTARERTLLGQVLLEHGRLTEEQLQTSLVEQERSGRPLGEVLITLGFVSEPIVAQALATQYGGLLKTEYGYATGFGRELRSSSPVTASPVASEAELAVASAVNPSSADVEELERELAAVTGELTAANARIPELERVLQTMSGELAEANARIPELERDLQTQERRLRTSDELAVVASQRITELGHELESARALIAAAAPAADALATEKRAQVDELERELERLSAALASAIACGGAQERDLQEARAALAAAVGRGEAQDRNLQEARAALAAAAARTETQDAALEASRAEKVRLAHELAEIADSLLAQTQPQQASEAGPASAPEQR